MELFKRQNALEFADRFRTDEDCLEYLTEIKWYNGFKCVKCCHSAYQQRKHNARICNKSTHIESATAHTLFPKVRIGVRKAFYICFEMSTTTKNLSAGSMSERIGATEKTARLFMQKVRESIKSSGTNPINGNVHVNEFVVGGKEEGAVGRSYHSKKKRAVCTVERTEERKVKRMYQ